MRRILVIVAATCPLWLGALALLGLLIGFFLESGLVALGYIAAGIVAAFLIPYGMIRISEWGRKQL